MKLFVGICNSQELIPSKFFWSFITVDSNWPVHVARSGNAYAPIRNNQLIKEFLKSDADIFIKMDVDQAYPTRYFLEMVPLVEKYKVIGPLIFDRHRQNNFMPLAFEGYDIETTMFRFFPILQKDEVTEVPYSHTNLFYAREVLEKIPPPWYECRYTDDGCSHAIHMDYTFLDKIKEAGYPIYINPKVAVRHISTESIDKRFYERWHGGLTHKHE
jgi:GT2 family glycosyltransferase